MKVIITTDNPTDGMNQTEFSNREEAANSLVIAAIQDLLRNPRIMKIVVATDYPHIITVEIKG